MVDHDMEHGGGSVPVPDPTTLTTEAVDRATLQYRRELNAVREILTVRIENLDKLLDERYATQTKALDAAFVAAEKAVATALDSAEKAVSKAEAANEIRFQGVNEFRKTLSDQTATFLPRQEYITAHEALEGAVADLRQALNDLAATVVPRNETNAWRTALTDKFDAGVTRNSERIAALELRLTSRLDLSAGADVGTQVQKGENRAVRGELSQVVIMLIMGLSVLVAIGSLLAFALKK